MLLAIVGIAPPLTSAPFRPNSATMGGTSAPTSSVAAAAPVRQLVDDGPLVVVVVAVPGDEAAVRTLLLGGGQVVGDGVVTHPVEVDDADGPAGHVSKPEQRGGSHRGDGGKIIQPNVTKICPLL